MSADIAEPVEFVTPDTRLPGCVIAGGFMLGGLAMSISALRESSLDIGSLLFGIIVSAGSFALLVSTLRGYAITVTGSSVRLHRLWTRELSFDRIASVDIGGPIMRTVQQRVCLRFTLVDGSTYLFKDFNGSTSETSESYRRVYEAMLLIRQRLDEAGATSAVQQSEEERENGPRSRDAKLEMPPPPPSPSREGPTDGSGFGSGS